MQTAAASGHRRIGCSGAARDGPERSDRAAIPGRGHLSERRWRPLSGQAHRRRADRGLGRLVARRPRPAGRRAALAQGNRDRMAARADALARQRPLARPLHAAGARPLPVRDRSLDRPVRHLAARTAAQARGRARTSRSKPREGRELLGELKPRDADTKRSSSAPRREFDRTARRRCPADRRTGRSGRGERSARRPDPQHLDPGRSPTGRARAPAPGTRWCRAARARCRAGTARSTIASRGCRTSPRSASTSSISRRSIRSARPTARAATTR